VNEKLLRRFQKYVLNSLNFIPITPSENSLRAEGEALLEDIKADLDSLEPPPLGVSVTEAVIARDKAR
jgi:hypothetical protein